MSEMKKDNAPEASKGKTKGALLPHPY
jgi:hypothetical protein